jgi:hypothetical protein
LLGTKGYVAVVILLSSARKKYGVNIADSISGDMNMLELTLTILALCLHTTLGEICLR